MCKLSCAAAVIVAAVCLPFFVAQSQQPARPSDLPPGPIQDNARAACTVCHDAGIITQQRLSKDAWTKEVDKMIRWGTQVEPKDRDALIDYLSSNFSPDKPAEPATRVATGK